MTDTPGSYTDWQAWHSVYDDPGSRFATRLADVQREVTRFLDAAATGPIVVLDICGGQSRTVLGALDGHPRASDVTLHLVELDPRNVAVARAEAARVGIGSFSAHEADAGVSDTYAGIPRANLLVMSGVFIHMTPRDRHRTARHLPELCAPDARLLWTLRDQGGVRRLRRQLTRSGFVRDVGGAGTGSHVVGSATMTGAPPPLRPGVRWFTFIPCHQSAANRARVKLGAWRRRILRRPLDS